MPNNAEEQGQQIPQNLRNQNLNFGIEWLSIEMKCYPKKKKKGGTCPKP